LHQAPQEEGLMLDDTDNFNALLRTPYTDTENPLYDTYFTNLTLVNGISMSLCAYMDNSLNPNNVAYKIRRQGEKYQSLILISNLNIGSNYSTMVVEVLDNGGAKLFLPVDFQTQSRKFIFIFILFLLLLLLLLLFHLFFLSKKKV
jgi:hypothetical protein